MDLVDIWVPILLILTAPILLAYPLDPGPQSLALTSPRLISQLNLTNSGQYNYPVYPTVCVPHSHEAPIKPSEAPIILSDCSWILNENLLRQHSLLFQNLLFRHSDFKDEYGIWHSSQWRHGRCVIEVSSRWANRQQRLQLFNVALSANQIVQECMVDKDQPRGGTTPIGFLGLGFYVGVIGLRAPADVDDEFDASSSSNFDLVRRDISQGHFHTTPTIEAPFGDFNTIDSTESVSPNMGLERRASDSQHGPVPLLDPEKMESRGAVSTLNLMMPSDDLSGNDDNPTYAVHCFDTMSVRLRRVATEDCELVVNHFIMTYPNLMTRQTFGYTSSADIDLSLPENEKWVHGCCVIFVKNRDRTLTDTFRMVDVAITAQRIITECVSGGDKYPKGGSYNFIADYSHANPGFRFKARCESKMRFAPLNILELYLLT